MLSPLQTIRGDRLISVEREFSEVSLYVDPNLHYPYLYVDEIDSLYLDSTYWVKKLDNGCTLYGVGRWYNNGYSNKDVLKVQRGLGAMIGISVYGTKIDLIAPLQPGFYLVGEQDEGSRLFMIACFTRAKLRPVSRVYREVSKKFYSIPLYNHYLTGGDEDVSNLRKDVKKEVLATRDKVNNFFKVEPKLTVSGSPRIQEATTLPKLTMSEPTIPTIPEDDVVYVKRSSTTPAATWGRNSLLNFAKKHTRSKSKTNHK